MATITVNYGSGGGHMAPYGHDSQPPLAEVLRDIADDLGSCKGATIAAPALLAFTDPPSAAEMGLLRTLVNEMRAAMISTAGTTLKTIKG